MPLNGFSIDIISDRIYMYGGYKMGSLRDCVKTLYSFNINNIKEDPILYSSIGP